MKYFRMPTQWVVFRLTRGKLIYLMVIVAGGTVASVLALRSRDLELTNGAAVWALGVFWLGLLPSLLYVARERKPPMPLFPMVGVFYGVSFGIAAFFSSSGMWWVSGEVGPDVLALVFTGFFLCLVCYEGLRGWALGQITPMRLPRRYSVRRLKVLLWFLLVGHVAYRVFPGLKDVPSVGQFFEPAGYVAWGMFYILWKSGRLTFSEKFLLAFVCLPVEFVVRLASGLLGEVVLLAIFSALVMYFWSRKPPVTLAIFASAFLIVMYPLRDAYRAHAWGTGPKTFRETVSDAAFFLSLAYQTYEEGDKVEIAGMGAERNISRISHIFEFDYVMKETPRNVPYWGGETYRPLFTKFIPRFLWPGKPVDQFGQEFGHRYRFIDPEDEMTSVNLPWIIEMYANFGSPGVFVGMAMVGFFLALVEAKFNRREMTPLEFVVGAATIFRLPFQESNFSLMVGGILLLGISLFAFFQVGLRAALPGSGDATRCVAPG